MYDPAMTAPMRHELVTVGVEDLTTPDLVDELLDRGGLALIVVNSVCGCAAGNARPGVMQFLQGEHTPDHVGTVFAGVDREATDRARQRFGPVPPSSPSMALLKDGELVHMLHRHNIEGRPPEAIAEELATAVQQNS
ncbi:MAG: BrxA/BrxB family bacilliredoxin [Planctomycetota bacterium]|jgi:putative YphP/YqiW family bacilliredoxin